MKKIAATSLLALTTAISNVQAVAESSTINEVERAATFSTAAVVGGIAGGPIGMIVGALGGAYLAEKSKKAEITEQELEMANVNIQQLEAESAHYSAEVAELEDRMAKKLEFQVMFPTGDDELAFQDMQRINSLAKYLKSNQELRVRLDGHADPRGTEEYNNVLSSERAKSVANALVDAGVEQSRIDIYAHGSSFAVTSDTSQDQYALERRVHIEVYQNTNEEVASAQ